MTPNLIYEKSFRVRNSNDEFIKVNLFFGFQKMLNGGQAPKVRVSSSYPQSDFFDLDIRWASKEHLDTFEEFLIDLLNDIGVTNGFENILIGPGLKKQIVRYSQVSSKNLNLWSSQEPTGTKVYP